MSGEHLLHTELKIAKELVYDPCGFVMTELKQNPESADYGASSFKLNGRKVEYRVSKITPTKVGQFVTIWKRNTEGITEPFDSEDELDFIIVTSKKEDKIGQFIFPKSVLTEMGIISHKDKEGKRGIRVYPPWDNVTSKQATKTQSWQTKYFVTVEKDFVNIELAKQLINKT